MIAPDCSDATYCLFTTVTVASQQLTPTGFGARGTWLFSSSVAAWISQGFNPTATAGAGSFLVPAGVVVEIDPLLGIKLAVLRVGAVDGVASLAKRRG